MDGRHPHPRQRRPGAQPAEPRAAHPARTSWSCSPGRAARANRRSPSTRSTPRATANTWRASRRQARQVLEQLKRPDVDFIHGLSPVLAIEQRTGGGSPRSTVATVTEVADYARLLWALCGEQRCPKDGGRVEKRSLDDCVPQLLRECAGRARHAARALACGPSQRAARRTAAAAPARLPARADRRRDQIARRAQAHARPAPQEIAVELVVDRAGRQRRPAQPARRLARAGVSRGHRTARSCSCRRTPTRRGARLPLSQSLSAA